MMPNRNATATMTIRNRVQNSLRPPPVASIQAVIRATSIPSVTTRPHTDDSSPRVESTRHTNA